MRVVRLGDGELLGERRRASLFRGGFLLGSLGSPRQSRARGLRLLRRDRRALCHRVRCRGRRATRRELLGELLPLFGARRRRLGESRLSLRRAALRRLEARVHDVRLYLRVVRRLERRGMARLHLRNARLVRAHARVELVQTRLVLAALRGGVPRRRLGDQQHGPRAGELRVPGRGRGASLIARLERLRALALGGFERGGVVHAQRVRRDPRDAERLFRVGDARSQARLRGVAALHALAEGRHLHGLHPDESLGPSILVLEPGGGLVRDLGAALGDALAFVGLRIPTVRPRLSLERPNLSLQPLYRVALRGEQTGRLVILAPQLREARVDGVVRLHGDRRVRPRRDGRLSPAAVPCSRKTRNAHESTAGNWKRGKVRRWIRADELPSRRFF